MPGNPPHTNLAPHVSGVQPQRVLGVSLSWRGWESHRCPDARYPNGVRLNQRISRRVHVRCHRSFWVRMDLAYHDRKRERGCESYNGRLLYLFRGAGGQRRIKKVKRCEILPSPPRPTLGTCKGIGPFPQPSSGPIPQLLIRVTGPWFSSIM